MKKSSLSASSFSSHNSSDHRRMPKASATRKSIAKNFELGCAAARGNRNPISLHSVDEEVFALVWTWIAETLVAETSLCRSSKEAITELISQHNDCPLCEKAHRIMMIAARQAEIEGEMNTIKCPIRKSRQWYKAEYHQQHPTEGGEGSSSTCAGHAEDKAIRNTQALEYADHLLTLWQQRSSKLAASREDSSSVVDESSDHYLTEQNKAEIALLVLLFNYMNRVVSSLLGEHFSSAFFRVPTSAALALESRAGFMAMMTRFMANGMVGKFKKTHLPGEISAALLGTKTDRPEERQEKECRDHPSTTKSTPDDDNQPPICLPRHLERATLAGEHCALALRRITTWVEQFEQTAIRDGLISETLLRALDDNSTMVPSSDLRAHRLVHWVTVTMRKRLQKSCRSEEDVTLAIVLLLVGYSPKSVFHSFHWDKLVEAQGEDTAKRLVIWWSLRWTLERAKGLDGNQDDDAGDELITS
ncbi:expressed unknown protein [Seminavis robusta]|uniref:Uncharacterized protein n=1 Tax=Seminavis robusta TaxID=568900 RepID=A0A9N8HWW0_9STRA|nr:expressed unknown protein [Seminavis robusta]|eukprot:Sro1707_g292590.1 n/a (474) ;mRNA; f:8981-10519